MKKCSRELKKNFPSYHGQYADVVLHGNLGKEEVIGEETLLEPA
jgi:hypothetical protein